MQGIASVRDCTILTLVVGSTVNGRTAECNAESRTAPGQVQLCASGLVEVQAEMRWEHALCLEHIHMQHQLQLHAAVDHVTMHVELGERRGRANALHGRFEACNGQLVAAQVASDKSGTATQSQHELLKRWYLSAPVGHPVA